MPLESTTDVAPVPAAPATVRPRYRRLPGRMPSLRLRVNGTSVLWLGDDHLLQVDTVYYTESYKRISFVDIQALLLRETPRGLVYSIILGVVAVGFGLAGWGMDDRIARNIFWGIGGVWVLLLIVNLGRGRTCRVHLQTAAGPHPLRSLNRVRPARKALRRITEKVETVQGALSPENAARQMDSRAR